jgi:hypothetical protein
MRRVYIQLRPAISYPIRTGAPLSHVVARGLEPASQRDVRDHAAQSPRARSDDHVVEMRVVEDDRRSRRFDDVGEVSVGKPPAHRVDRRRREDHVANLPETN